MIVFQVTQAHKLQKDIAELVVMWFMFISETSSL